jgi:hypothetical protein
VSSWRKVVPYAILSLVSFLLGAGLLGLMLWNAERLVALGLAGNFYYVTLLPLGAAVAGFLFGVFRSYARYTGKVLDGRLELGGPIVGLALTVLGGFYLPKPAAEDFHVTVLVHGGGGATDLVLRNEGEIWITLGADRRHEKIDDKGQADFKNVPSRFRGASVPVTVLADGFEPAQSGKEYALAGGAVNFEVRRADARLKGIILDKEGRPVSDAKVRAGDAQTNSDNSGHFALTIPAAGGAELQLEVSATGHEVWRGKVASGSETQIQLR